MTKVIRIISTVALSVAVVFAMSAAVFASSEAVAGTATTYAARPSVGAGGAIAYCGETGQILYGKNINKRLDPYSTTKIMTAYVVMKYIDEGKLTLDTEVTATKADVNLVETRIYLQVGEKMKVRYLLKGALIESGNDAAAALGEAVAGDRASFAKIMNKEAARLGCTNTHFVNANGIKAADHYTTVHDMALIARAAFKYRYIQKICQTRTCSIPATNIYCGRYLRLTNPFFYKHGKVKKPYKVYNIVAGKTGTWDDWDSSLVEMSSYNGKTIYTVVLRDPVAKRYSDSVKLIKYARAQLDTLNTIGAATMGTSLAEPTVSQSYGFFERLGRILTPKKLEISLFGETRYTAARGLTTQNLADKAVELRWQKVQGADGYRVYRTTGSSWELVTRIKSGSASAYRDSDVKAGKSYRYTVIGYDYRDGMLKKYEN